MPTLSVPETGAQIQTIDGISYLVARLEEGKNCEDFIADLRKGNPVVVPFSKRGHLTGQLKKLAIYTRYETIMPGLWVAFFPCGKREFR